MSRPDVSDDVPANGDPQTSRNRRNRRGRRRRGRRGKGPADQPNPAATPSVTGGSTSTSTDDTGPKPSDLAAARTRRESGSPAAMPKSKRRNNSSTGKKSGVAAAQPRLRTVRETSAGGLVLSSLDDPYDEIEAVLIGRIDRRGRMMWSLPKGHIETGETAETTAIREVTEETGVSGSVIAPLGKIDYWFVSEGKRIHKTVHHFLLRYTGGELSDADYEVSEVAWVRSPSFRVVSRTLTSDGSHEPPRESSPNSRAIPIAWPGRRPRRSAPSRTTMREPQPPATSAARIPRRRRSRDGDGVDPAGGTAAASRPALSTASRVNPQVKSLLPRTTATVPADAARPVRAGVLAGVLLLIATLLPFGTAPARAADPGFATLSVTEITPTTVTGETDTVRVRGRITNTFDRPIAGLRVELRVGPAVSDATALRTSLMAPPTDFPTAAPSQAIADSLGAGSTAPFDVSVPVAGEDGLGISSAGVYPLMVNAIGDPERGGPVPVAQSSTLLPVLSVPGQDDSGPDADNPAILTMVWPLAAPPQLMPGVLGGGTEPVRLTSDALAESLQTDGRLGGQLEALRKAFDDSDDVRLQRSICLAVDPDLLVTVEGMSRGYMVSTNPADPRSPTEVGSGQAAAASWLEKLRSLAPKTCVVALPYAQAGLDSLKLIDEDVLTASALIEPADIVDQMLNVQSLRGFTIPAVGALSDDGRDLLASIGTKTAAVASTSIDPSGRTTTGRYRTGDVALQTYEAPISAALGAAGSRVSVPPIVPNWQQPRTSDESEVSRRQAAVASMAFPMLSGSSNGSGTPVTGRSAFVMPPTYWSPTGEDADALLQAARTHLASGSAVELPLTDLAAHLQAADDQARLVTPGDIDPVLAQGFPISSANASTVRDQLTQIGRLQGALVGSRVTSATPQSYMQPLRQDQLRAVSTPSSPSLDEARTARGMRLSAVSSTLTRMEEAVSLLDPGGRYTLASERSPLLLVVQNQLALPIRVRLKIDAPDSLNVGDVGAVEIPPIGTRQLSIPTHASTSERATVNIALQTSTGVPLNDPVELSVFSNRYGRPLFWITVGAAIILVLLTARRLWHRFRGEPDPADADRPEPGERERELASTPYKRRLAVAREEHVEHRESSGGEGS